MSTVRGSPYTTKLNKDRFYCSKESLLHNNDYIEAENELAKAINIPIFPPRPYLKVSSEEMPGLVCCHMHLLHVHLSSDLYCLCIIFFFFKKNINRLTSTNNTVPRAVYNRLYDP